MKTRSQIQPVFNREDDDESNLFWDISIIIFKQRLLVAELLIMTIKEAVGRIGVIHSQREEVTDTSGFWSDKFKTFTQGTTVVSEIIEISDFRGTTMFS